MRKTICSHVLATFCLTLCLPAQAETIHVSAAAKGNGSGRTWASARTDLADALNKAQPGDMVWVAAGTYVGPISLKDSVQLYGGFSGTETDASQRNPLANPTYISGGGQSRAVVSYGNDRTAVLNGFHVVDGFIDLPETGGGLYLERSDATIERCVFTRNRAAYAGGAVANWWGSPRFVNCRFHGNTSDGTAAAVFNRRSGKPTFENCLFYENKALEAGVVGVLSGTPTFINCTFVDNQATIGKGGAFFDNR